MTPPEILEFMQMKGSLIQEMEAIERLIPRLKDVGIGKEMYAILRSAAFHGDMCTRMVHRIMTEWADLPERG